MTLDISALVLGAGEGEATLATTGELLIWKATAKTTNGLYDQVEIFTLPQAGPPEHTHPQDELFYFLEGTYRVKLEDQLFTATPGTFIRVPAGVPHTWRSGLQGGKILLTYIPGGVRPFFEELQALMPPMDIQASNQIAIQHGLTVTGPPLTDE